MFIGHSKHVLDPQTFRVIIPSKLREAMTAQDVEKGFIATVGLDGCLALYTERGWQAMASAVNMGEFDARTFQRMLFGMAERVHCDPQGRVVLPQRLLDLLGLKGEVVIAGADDRIEIWSPQRWADIEASQRLFYEQLAKSYFGARPAQDLTGSPAAPAVERTSSGAVRPPSAPRNGGTEQ